MITPHYWTQATAHLSQQCRTMAAIIATYEGESMQARPDGFFTLLRAICGQQISVKAADAVWAKFTKAVKPLTPQKLLRVRDTTLRACGLSGQKVAYVKNIAQFFAENEVTPEYWAARDDSEVNKALVSIKGVGTWTAEMFMMFHLARPDIFPIGDLGLIKAIDRHYTNGVRLKPAEYIALAEPWRPYRSVATWYLWRAIDPVPVAY
ncbi:MAG: DNA-3-methyladenine glycosylase [Rhodospirillales bacterium 12-54-5]|nr:MAG: DNA-3-methyladenine glycosylase [Rhodospirillales bacterium 12-54-5]